jgi:hypothetical protein
MGAEGRGRRRVVVIIFAGARNQKYRESDGNPSAAYFGETDLKKSQRRDDESSFAGVIQLSDFQHSPRKASADTEDTVGARFEEEISGEDAGMKL